jgi:hypothetical protein
MCFDWFAAAERSRAAHRSRLAAAMAILSRPIEQW